MPLPFRSHFYDAADVAARDRRPWPHFDWMAVLRAQSCYRPGLLAVQYRTEREKLMVDPSDNEIAALEACSIPAGAFLEQIGKTDLAVLSPDEWMTFLEVVVSAFQDKMAELHSPYAVNRSSDDPFAARVPS